MFPPLISNIFFFKVFSLKNVILFKCFNYSENPHKFISFSILYTFSLKISSSFRKKKNNCFSFNQTTLLPFHPPSLPVQVSVSLAFHRPRFHSLPFYISPPQSNYLPPLHSMLPDPSRTPHPNSGN